MSARLAEIRRRSNSGAARRALATGIGRASATFTATAALVGVVATGIAAHEAGHLSGVMLAVEAFVAARRLRRVRHPATRARRSGRRAVGSPPPVGARRPPGPGRRTRSRLRPTRGRGRDRLRPGPGHTRRHRRARRVVPDGSRRGNGSPLVGRSGSGKTSALHALLHFVPCTSGRASIGGVDVARITRAGIARHIGWVDDVTHVFAASLGDNLRIADVGGHGVELRRGAGRRRARRLARLPAGGPGDPARRRGTADERRGAPAARIGPRVARRGRHAGAR